VVEGATGAACWHRDEAYWWRGSRLRALRAAHNTAMYRKRGEGRRRRRAEEEHKQQEAEAV